MLKKTNPNSKKETNSSSHLSFSKLSLKSLILLSGLSLLCGVALWQAIRPYMAEFHYHEGYNFEASKRLKYAIEEYELAVKYAPWETQYQLDLAKVYSDFAAELSSPAEKMTYLKKSEDTCLRMIQIDGKNPWYKNKLATIYLSMAEVEPEKSNLYLDKADYYVRSAAESDSHNPLFQMNLAFFLHRLKKYDEAYLYYKKTLEFDDSLIEAQFNLADVYIRQGQYDQAMDCYLKVAEKKPDFQNLGLAISSLSAELYRQTKDPAKLRLAIVPLEKLLKLNSADLETLRPLAFIYQQLGDVPNTRRICQQILTFYPNLTEYRTALNRTFSE